MQDKRDISEITLSGTEAVAEGSAWEAYRSYAALNPSTIVEGLKSLRHLRYRWENGRADNDNFGYGRAVHTLLYEPAEFPIRYMVYDGKRDKRVKRYAEFLEKVKAYDGEVLTAKQLQACQEAAKSFVNYPEVQKIIAAGKPEITLLTTEFGLQCKGRIDWISAPSADDCISDLKTTRSLNQRSIGYDFFKFHYDTKLGLYRRWWHKLSGRLLPVRVIWQEKEPPYDVSIMTIPDAILDAGADKGMRVIEQVAEAIRTDCWPGVVPDGEEMLLEVPFHIMAEADLEGAEEYAA